MRASLVVFVASFCTLVLEIVAGRVLAPYVGVSLYTWTSIIGVVLAGISGGAWAGGWLADRRPAESTLAWLLLASGVAAMLIAPATEMLAGEQGLLTAANLAMTLLARVLVLSFLLFFVPSFLLGMISPVAVRLAMRDVATAGTIVGRISAVSTLGSIAGTFVTGFYLVARFGTKTTIVGAGAVLIAGSLMLFARRAGTVIVAVLFAGVLLFAASRPLPPPVQTTELPSSQTGFIHAEESQYYAIRVQRTVRPDTGAPIHALHLDKLVHSYSDRADPSFLEYGYLRIFDEVARASGGSRLLFIGGGGYTLPRRIEQEHPRMRIDVVEIDPAVTRIAKRFFGLPRKTRIRTINEDARWFTMRERGPYDVVFIDAFNDLSVPYHLATREYALELRRLPRTERHRRRKCDRRLRPRTLSGVVRPYAAVGLPARGAGDGVGRHADEACDVRRARLGRAIAGNEVPTARGPSRVSRSSQRHRAHGRLRPRRPDDGAAVQGTRGGVDGVRASFLPGGVRCKWRLGSELCFLVSTPRARDLKWLPSKPKSKALTPT